MRGFRPDWLHGGSQPVAGPRQHGNVPSHSLLKTDCALNGVRATIIQVPHGEFHLMCQGAQMFSLVPKYVSFETNMCIKICMGNNAAGPHLDLLPRLSIKSAERL
jgi:hypothetical protein